MKNKNSGVGLNIKLKNDHKQQYINKNSRQAHIRTKDKSSSRNSRVVQSSRQSHKGNSRLSLNKDMPGPLMVHPLTGEPVQTGRNSVEGTPGLSQIVVHTETS